VFNLIVKHSGWAESHDTLISSRAFEYTADIIQTRFKPNGKINFESLRVLPTLFIEESFGDKNQLARVGTIIRARETGSEIALEYFYDPDVPPIPNKKLEAISNELDMNSFEFNRTHWAIKDQDLFRVLFRHFQPRRLQPKVFRLNEPEQIEDILVSAMMPFQPQFDPVYKTLRDVSKANGLRCRRADDIWENPAVMQDVVSLIDKSKIVICDCTGRNPNVFYEVGIAHTLGREVILITQSKEDIPFDLRHLRYVHYLNIGEGLAVLSDKLQQRISALIGK